MESKRTIEVSCPACHGPLSEVREDDRFEYRCLVGHSYSALSVMEAHSDAEETALWSAVVALEEASNLVSAVSGALSPELAGQLAQQAESRRAKAQELRRILEALEPYHLD